ncbi:LPS export ABC transporter periplasmic protein LptC, partial [Haemophilus paraphrohaemolyticus]
MNKRITALLLVIVAALVGWMQYQAKDDANGLDNLIKKEGMPDYTGHRMSTSVFDLEGKPEYYAEAEEIKRYEESEKTEFTNPLVNLFDKLTALKQWKLSADHAEINAERILTLSGNVTLQALEPTSKL